MIQEEQDIAANIAVVQEYLQHEFPRARIELVLAREPKRQADRMFRIHDTAAF